MFLKRLGKQFVGIGYTWCVLNLRQAVPQVPGSKTICLHIADGYANGVFEADYT